MLGVLFAFSGRIGRRNFWLVGLLTLLIMVGVFAVTMGGHAELLTRAQVDPEAMIELENAIAEVIATQWPLLLGAALLCFWMNMAAAIKRLHDLDRTGWLYLFAVGISIIPLIGAIIYLCWLIYVGFFPGTKGENHYGEGPRKIFGNVRLDAASRAERRSTGNYGMAQTDDWHGSVDSYKEALRRKAEARSAEKAGPTRIPRSQRVAPRSKGFGKRGEA